MILLLLNPTTTSNNIIHTFLRCETAGIFFVLLLVKYFKKFWTYFNVIFSKW